MDLENIRFQLRLPLAIVTITGPRCSTRSTTAA